VRGLWHVTLARGSSIMAMDMFTCTLRGGGGGGGGGGIGGGIGGGGGGIGGADIFATPPVPTLPP
jgi:hypothetical protein